MSQPHRDSFQFPLVPATGMEFASLMQKAAPGQAALGAIGLPCGRTTTVSEGRFGEMGKLSRKEGEFRLLQFWGEQHLRYSALPKIQGFVSCWHLSESKKGCLGKMQTQVFHQYMVPKYQLVLQVHFCLPLCYCSEAIITSACLARRKGL